MNISDSNKTASCLEAFQSAKQSRDDSPTEGIFICSSCYVVLDHKNTSLSITSGLRQGDISKTKIMQVFAYGEPHRKELQTRVIQGWK